MKVGEEKRSYETDFKKIIYIYIEVFSFYEGLGVDILQNVENNSGSMLYLIKRNTCQLLRNRATLHNSRDISYFLCF